MNEKIVKIPDTKVSSLFKDKRFFSYLRKILISPFFYHIIRFSISLIFIYAGFIKLVDPKAFAKAISQYELVPEVLLAPIAIGLPAIEVLAGVGLIFSIRGSLSIIFGLLIIFVFVLWYGILRNLDIDCGCFSPEELKSHASLWHAFYRDISMIVAVIYLFISDRLLNRTKSLKLIKKEEQENV
ncbi:MAG: DoxX family membrane protein [Nitrospirae bacterium]|nr:DoxX family membrane protein [Nitrospirota bacterium]